MGTRRVLVYVLAALVATSAPLSAREFAKILCYPRAEMLEILRTTLGERPAGSGIQRPAQVVEVWTSDRTGEWMFVTTDMDGLSCIVAHGEGWQGRAEPLGAPTPAEADPS